MSRPIGTFPIRVGCYVEFIRTYSNGAQDFFRGTVIESQYFPAGHTFVVQHISDPKWKMELTGKKLYTNLQYHDPGEKSLIDYKRTARRGKKRKKQRRQIALNRSKRRWN